jgi:hypothetical protein
LIPKCPKRPAGGFEFNQDKSKGRPCFNIEEIRGFQKGPAHMRLNYIGRRTALCMFVLAAGTLLWGILR